MNVKSFIRISVASLLWFSCVAGFAQQQFDAMKTPQINTTYYVGQVQGFYPAIQNAVTAACARSGARVDIPAGTIPTDTIAAVTAGCTTASILDERALPNSCYAWNGTAYAASSCTTATGGTITSVNGCTGPTCSLTYTNVGADAAGAAAAAQTAAATALAASVTTVNGVACALNGASCTIASTGGTITSVNGCTGPTCSLTYSNVGADASGAAAAAQTAATNAAATALAASKTTINSVNCALNGSCSLTPANVGADAAGAATTAAAAAQTAATNAAATALAASSTNVNGVTCAVNGAGCTIPTVARVTYSQNYTALGDSITAGFGLSDPVNQRYPTLLAADLGLVVGNYSISGDQACDVWPRQIKPAAAGPTLGNAPLTTILIGTNDLRVKGTGAYEQWFNSCDQAIIAWQAIPAEYKQLPGDARIAVSGSCVNAPSSAYNNGLLCSNPNPGSITVTMTTTGAPFYIWETLNSGFGGADFDVSVDGGTATTFHARAAPMGTTENGTSNTVGFYRFPVAAGAHTFTIFSVIGGTAFQGFATPPPPGRYYNQPVVAVGDVPNMAVGGSPYGTPAGVAQYTADIRANIATFLSDGLDIRFVPTQQYFLGTPAEMIDTLHPNFPLGESHLKQAFENFLQAIPASSGVSATLRVGPTVTPASAATGIVAGSGLQTFEIHGTNPANKRAAFTFANQFGGTSTSAYEFGTDLGISGTQDFYIYNYTTGGVPLHALADDSIIIGATTTAPTCNAAHHGATTIVLGGTGVADVSQICKKDATDTYAWHVY